MTKYLTEYKNYILNCLNDENTDFKKLIAYHLDKIKFFQHERFIHLIVTVLFAICTIMCILAIVIWQNISLLPLAILLLILLIPYIKHYYFLENSVQQLYKYYDKMYEKAYGFSQKSEDTHK